MEEDLSIDGFEKVTVCVREGERQRLILSNRYFHNPTAGTTRSRTD